MLQAFDILSNPNRQVRKETVIGGVISAFALIFIVFLFYNEYSNFETLTIRKNLYLDPKPLEETIQVSLKLRLYNAPCGIISLDLLDDLKHHRVDIGIRKTKIDKDGADKGEVG